MKQTGTVVSSDGGTAKIKVRRTSACGENCAHCGGSCGGLFMIVTAENQADAKPGDTVELEMPSSKVLTAALWIYIVPVAVFIVGYAILAKIFVGELIPLIGALILTGLMYGTIIAFNRKKTDKYRLIIEKVL